MEQVYQEVDYFKYCQHCKYYKKAENEMPCAECLDNATNLYTDRPVRFEEKKCGRKKKGSI